MEVIGDFEYSKKELIGHGAFAVVFKGRHRKKHDLTVAIKCITKKNLAKSQNLLSKEIKILKELSDLHHENVVALLDCKETSHHVYLVMEYCNGGDLADYLNAKGTLSEDTIALFLRQIAGAMKALNAKGVVHRDLKPQNILLHHQGKTNPPPTEIRLKIADFGFARFLQDGVMAATLCGSPMYMAPEVIMSIQYDAKADLWSIGTIVYQCLTGKAPFQAQTPQQLKQFYEKNANLSPNIPSGTSPEMRDLLMKLLKRNARDRIDFDLFFKHPFLSTGLQPKSSPVPVPRSRSRSSIGESPSIKTVSASPLSGNVPMSPAPHDGARPGSIGVDVGSPREVGGFLNVCKMETDSGTLPARAGSPGTEDYVMVPENVPSDHSVSSYGSQKNPGSVDLNTIFSDTSTPDSPSPSTTRQTETKPDLPQLDSPSRPSSLPVQSPGSPSAPIPVPGQVTRVQPRLSPVSPVHQKDIVLQPASLSPHSPRVLQRVSSQGVAIPPRKSSNTNIPSIGSMSPPAVQFTIGTPPSTSWARRGSYGTPPLIRTGTTPPLSGSPLRRVCTGSSPALTGNAFLSPAPLPTILGSPTKNPAEIEFPGLGTHLDNSPDVPIQAPFGGRTRTFPDNITAVGFVEENRNVIPLSAPLSARDRSATLPESLLRAAGGSPGLSEHWLRAAFASPSTIAAQHGQHNTFSRQTMLPFSSSPRQDSPLASPIKENTTEKFPFYNKRQAQEAQSYLGQSPPNMEGPISFVAPELEEEILMEKEHNETLAKLNFVQALVDCIIDLARSRSSPISESYTQRHGEVFTLDRVTFISEEQRVLEQVVLYMRALQLLSSSFQLGREEIKGGRLQPSSSVKAVLMAMKISYHKCLSVCKQFHKQGAYDALRSSAQVTSVTADRLIYAHALEMCQTAALDEIFGNPNQCFRHYRSAQILLHSLAQQAQDPVDRNLLNQYKESVEKRLFNLYNQGYIRS